jgi:hypothetical protein
MACCFALFLANSRCFLNLRQIYLSKSDFSAKQRISAKNSGGK